MTSIKLGRSGYWHTPDGFARAGGFHNSAGGDRPRAVATALVTITDDDRGPLLRYLVSCLFGLNRWQGEADDDGERWSVGRHSLLVAALAGRLALVRGWSAEDVRMAVRLGAVHDLGEALGLGDIAAPWLRSDAHFARLCRIHQRHAAALAGLDDGTRPDDPASFTMASALVKDADHLAAALERRYFFDDFSRDMESPVAGALIGEADLRYSGAYRPLLITGDDEGDDIASLIATVIGESWARWPVVVVGETMLDEVGEVFAPRRR